MKKEDIETIAKKIFPPIYQNKVGQFANEKLHDISKEIVSFVKKHDLIQPNYHFFEIGSGGARNLWYIWKKNNDGYKGPINLSCNDLWEKESKENMHNDIKNRINFYEGDTEKVLLKLPKIDIDVLLSVDHLMHLPKVKGKAVIKLINDKVKPKYVIIRERKKEFETSEIFDLSKRKIFRNYHNYEILEDNYKLIEELTSTIDKAYFLRIYKLKI